MTGHGGNGHVPDPRAIDGPAGARDSVEEAALDELDAMPLDEDEAAAGAAAADAEVDESVAQRVEAVVAGLDGVERRAEAGATAYATGGRVFAVLAGDRLEASLDGAVAKAALRTPDTTASPRGRGWIAFAPPAVDRYALDRAEAWVRSAHRRASSAG